MASHDDYPSKKCSACMIGCCKMFCCCYLCEDGEEYMEQTWEMCLKTCAVWLCCYCDIVGLRGQEKATRDTELNNARCRAIILQAQAPRNDNEMVRV